MTDWRTELTDAQLEPYMDAARTYLINRHPYDYPDTEEGRKARQSHIDYDARSTVRDPKFPPTGHRLADVLTIDDGDTLLMHAMCIDCGLDVKSYRDGRNLASPNREERQEIAAMDT